MKIDINIPKIMCDTVLKKNNYVTEKVTLYYDEYDGYTVDDASYKPIESVIAYPNGSRPEVLDNEYPLMEDLEDFMYDRVVEDLFNSWLMEVLSKH